MTPFARARYFARAPGEYTIDGADGWMSQNRFAGGMRVALRRSMQICIDDMRGQFTGTRTLKAKGVFPFVKSAKFELPFIAVRETNDAVVGRLAGDLMVMAGPPPPQ